MGYTIGGCPTFLIQNCTEEVYYGLTMFGKVIEIPPWTSFIEDSSRNGGGFLNPIGKIRSALEITHHLGKGFPVKEDGTIKIITAYPVKNEKHRTYENEFKVTSVYNPKVWEGKGFIPILEMNMVISNDLEYLKRLCSQFESGAECVKALLDGLLHTYDGLTCNIINCSEHTYYTIIRGRIVKLPSPKDVIESSAKYGRRMKRSTEEYKNLIVQEFGLNKFNVEKGYDLFLISVLNNDFPRRSINLDTLPDVKNSIQKEFFQVLWEQGSEVENMMPVIINSIQDFPIFKSKQAARYFLEEFEGSMENYYRMKEKVNLSHRLDGRLDKVRKYYKKRNRGVIKMTRRFVKSTLFEKAGELAITKVGAKILNTLMKGKQVTGGNFQDTAYSDEIDLNEIDFNDEISIATIKRETENKVGKNQRAVDRAKGIGYILGNSSDENQDSVLKAKPRRNYINEVKGYSNKDGLEIEKDNYNRESRRRNMEKEIENIDDTRFEDFPHEYDYEEEENINTENLVDYQRRNKIVIPGSDGKGTINNPRKSDDKFNAHRKKGEPNYEPTYEEIIKENKTRNLDKRLDPDLSDEEEVELELENFKKRDVIRSKEEYEEECWEIKINRFLGKKWVKRTLLGLKLAGIALTIVGIVLKFAAVKALLVSILSAPSSVLAL